MNRPMIMHRPLKFRQRDVQGYTTIFSPHETRQSNLEEQPLEDIIFFLGTKDIDVSFVSIKYDRPGHESKYTLRGKGYEMRFLDFAIPGNDLPLEKEDFAENGRGEAVKGWMREVFPHISITEDVLFKSKVGIAGVCGYLHTKGGDTENIEWAFEAIMKKYARAIEPNGFNDRSSLDHEILDSVEDRLPRG